MKSIKLMMFLAASSALFGSESSNQESFFLSFSNGQVGADSIDIVTWDQKGCITRGDIQFFRVPGLSVNEVIVSKGFQDKARIHQKTFDKHGKLEAYGFVLEKIRDTNFFVHSPLGNQSGKSFAQDQVSKK